MSTRAFHFYLIFGLLLAGCYGEDEPAPVTQPNCQSSTLTVEVSATDVAGCNDTNGTIMAVGSGGEGAILYSLNGGTTTQSSGEFTNLGAGTYQVTVLDDNCTNQTSVTVGIANSDLDFSVASITNNTNCNTSDGSVQLQATGGSGSYSFTLNGATNQTGTFTNLSTGTYSAILEDGGCSLSVSFTVETANPVSFSGDLVTIFQTRCSFSSCHGSGAPQFDLTNYALAGPRANTIKSRTQSGSMPPASAPGGELTAEELALIACWVDEGANNN